MSKNPILQEQETTVREVAIIDDKRFRRALDEVLQDLKSAKDRYKYISRERSLAITKLQEAIMWLGMDLKELGGPSPYPNSYDPTNTIVDPTADGLKM